MYKLIATCILKAAKQTYVTLEVDYKKYLKGTVFTVLSTDKENDEVTVESPDGKKITVSKYIFKENL